MNQDHLQTIREMEAEAREVADTATRTFEEIRAKRIRIEAARGIQQEGEPQEFRAKIIRGPWIVGIGIAAGAAGRWLGRHSRPIAATSASLLMAGTATMAVIQQPWNGTDRAARPVEVPTYDDLPPIGHTSPPHIGPPKSGPPVPVPQQLDRPDMPGHGHPLVGKGLPGHPLRTLVPPHPAKPVRSALPAVRAPIKPRTLLPTTPGCRIRLRQTRLCLPGTGQS